MAATSHGYLLQISARTLGELTLANFCERCFWIKLHHRDRMPYSIPMPGIFSSIDSYSKKVIHAHFEQHGRLPLWYPAVGPVVAIIRAPHWSRFRYVDPATQICLTGVPDELLELADGSSCIVDYKTARLTQVQDALFPLYEVQLNAYAYIGMRARLLPPVSALRLVYTEPVTELEVAAEPHSLTGAGFNLGFAAASVTVSLKLDGLQPLLHRAKDIYMRLSAPGGLGGCLDCARLEHLLSLTTQGLHGRAIGPAY